MSKEDDSITLTIPKAHLSALFNNAMGAFAFVHNRDNEMPMFAQDVEVATAVCKNTVTMFQQLVFQNPTVMAEVAIDEAERAATNPETSDEEAVRIAELVEALTGLKSMGTEGQQDTGSDGDSGCSDCGACSCDNSSETTH